MKKGMTKRSISMFMAVILVLGMIVTALPAGLFTTTTEAAVSYSPDVAGACLIPTRAYTNMFFMRNHVFGSSNYNLNKNFKAYSWSGNLSPGLSKNQSLDRTKRTKKNHDSLWYANWRYYPNDVMKALMSSGQIEMGYRTNLYNDKHSNGKHHWGKKWGKAMIELKGSSQGRLLYNETENKNDEQAQQVQSSCKVKSNSYFNYWAGNNRCVCNGSCVGGNNIYAADTTMPLISKCYISKTMDGSAVAGEGFKANETGYLVLECSESIRFGNASASALKLNLVTYWKKNGQKAGTISAQLVKLQGKKLVFSFTVPEKISNQATDVVVRTIEMPGGNDTWASSNGNYAATFVDENGNAKSFWNYKLTAVSKITDLAGNGLNWSASTKTISNEVFLDNVNVGIQKVLLDVTKAQRADIPVDESEGDASLSDVFTAVGDKLCFTVTFNDKLSYPAAESNKKKFLENISATLNVKNANGYIKLKAASIKSLSAAEVDGVDSALGSKTQITFEVLNVTADMYQEGGQPVKITALNGMGSVKDICGNSTTGMNNVTVAPERQQFIDRLAPKATLGLDAADGVYTPISSNNGKTLTFPVNVDDAKESSDTNGVYSSGVTGIIGGFKWVCGTGSQTYAYDYCWSTTSKAPDNAVWKRLYTTADENNTGSNVNGKIIQYEKGNGTLYLHIRLIDGVDYGAATVEKAGKVTGNLVISTMDYAGNKGKDSFALSYTADNTAPSLEQKGSSIDGNAARTEAKITSTLKAADDYGVQSVTYQWSGQQAQQCDISAYENRRNIEIPVTCTYDDSDIDADNKKTVSLKVTVTDFAGHTTEQTFEYTLYFGKIENRYSINVGTSDKPLACPVLMMKKPDAIINADNTTTELLSYVEVKFTDAERYIYFCNSTTEEDIFAQNGWYFVEKRFTDDNSPGAPQLSYYYYEIKNGESVSVSLLDRLAECYGTGEVTITVRTIDTYEGTTDIDSDGNEMKVFSVRYDSLDAIAFNEHADVYLANKGKYSATVGSVVDSSSQDVKGLLAYDAQTSTQTAYSLDGVSFVYTLAGQQESRFNYNFADIDTSASYVRLRKTADGSKHTAESADAVDGTDPVCETYELAGAREQGFTVSSDISENNGSGWYYLEFVVTTTDGDQHVTYYNDIYVDRYVYSDFWSAYYNKTYSKVMEYKSEQKEVVYKTADNIDVSYVSQYGNVLGMGIAAAPEGYTVTQQLSFEGKLCESDSGVVRNLKFRIYNQADSANAQNAGWRDLTETDGAYKYIYNIREASTDDSGKYVFDEASYYSDGQYYVPVTEGMNVICYEVINTNGQIDKKTLLINATKQTVLKDYNKEEKPTELKWILSDAAIDESPNAVMKLHDFYTEEVYNYSSVSTSCRESGSWEFVMYNIYNYIAFYTLENFNDNLVADTITAENVDGIAPSVNMDYQQEGMNFRFKFDISDNNTLDMNNLVEFVYDGYYGYKIKNADDTLSDESDETVPGEEDGPSVSDAPDPWETSAPYEPVEYNVRFGQSGDVTSAACWEDYSTTNYGIYKTQYIPNDSENNTGGTVYVWGAFMYQDDVPEGEECYGNIELYVKDANGNHFYTGQSYSYTNAKPELQVNGSAVQRNEYLLCGNMYSYDDTTSFDSNGNLFVESYSPLSSIHNYGAGKNVAAVTEEHVIIEPGKELTSYSDYKYYFLSPLTMLRSAGQYELEFTDIFGNSYKQELDTTGAFEEGSDRIRINYSETKQTNQNVTVMANLTAPSGEAVDPDAKILTISAVSVDENGNRVMGQKGEIDLIDPTAARMVMEDNGEVYIEGIYDGQLVSKTARVSNIDKKIEDVTPVFLYDNGSTEPNFMEGSEDTVDGSVKVILDCDEDLYGLNGDTKYVFPVGSKKGDKYTFEYRDEAGNTASTTVTLPYNIDKTVPPVPDTTAPEFTGIVSGLRHSYAALDGIFDVDESGNVSESARANESMAQYIARGYKLVFQVTDESKVKLVAKKAGADAPTSYNDNGDSIDGLRITGYTVEITKPAQFDLYFIDEAGNVKALKGFAVDSFDQEAADVSVQYKVLRDENDVAFVRAYLVADPAEEVAATNQDATTFMNEETVVENGVETTKLVKRYYRDFFENETYVFTYIDVYGNTGSATAQVQGFDYGAPAPLGVQWFGTRRMTGTESGSFVINESPDTEGLAAVNNDVTADISYNKAVSGIKLYVYDETKENNAGAEITSADGVSAAYVGKKVTVTYADNYDRQIVVSTQAKNSGKRNYMVLPAVQCIDKKAPVITVSQGILSQDKQKMTYTITTDEEVFFNNGTVKAAEHTYTVRKNGESVITVMDAAGNSSSVSINVTEIDDTAMELMFGLQPDGSDMTADIDNLDIKTGDTLYVKASKEAHVICGGRSLHLMANETGSVQLTSDAGMYLLRAVDASTGKEQTYKVLMTIRDSSAPLVSFDTAVLSFPLGTEDAVIETALRSGITIEDNKDGIIDSANAAISGIPEQWKKGIHIITYAVSDSEGNTAYATRSVYLYEEGTPNIQINGEDAMPYGTTVVNSSTIHVKGTGSGTGALLMKYRPGVKTAAQMKYGTTGAMLKGASKNEEQTFMLPKRSGFYTLYIRTQDRKEQITYVYVDLSE